MHVKVLYEGTGNLDYTLYGQAADISFDLGFHVVYSVLCKFGTRVLGTIGGVAVDQVLQSSCHRDVRDQPTLSELSIPASTLSDSGDIDECSLSAVHRLLERSFVNVVGRYDLNTSLLQRFRVRFGKTTCKGTDCVLLR